MTRAEDLEEVLVEFYGADPARAHWTVAKHALDQAGRCVMCKSIGCLLRLAAERALARRSEGGAP